MLDSSNSIKQFLFTSSTPNDSVPFEVVMVAMSPLRVMVMFWLVYVPAKLAGASKMAKKVAKIKNFVIFIGPLGHVTKGHSDPLFNLYNTCFTENVNSV